MKFTLCIASIALASCSALPYEGDAPDSSALKDNRFSVYLGQRYLDDGDWSPVDEQPTFGLEFAQEKQDSVIGWELGIMGSTDDDDIGGVDVEVSTGEVYGGVRKTFGSGVVRPYLGGGLSWIDLNVDVQGFGDEDDSSIAGYAHGGVAFVVTESFFIGLDLRVLFGSDLNIAGFDTDADYEQLALMLGFAF